MAVRLRFAQPGDLSASTFFNALLSGLKGGQYDAAFNGVLQTNAILAYITPATRMFPGVLYTGGAPWFPLYESQREFCSRCGKESGMPDTYVGAGHARRSVRLAGYQGREPLPG